MRYMNYALIFVLLVFFTSCSKNSTNPSNGFTVSGYIFSEGHALAEVIVTIDNLSTLKNVTNSEGYFNILNVSSGNHELNAYKSLSNGGYLERSTLVSVEDNVNVGILILPVGVQLYEPEKITDRSLILKWSPTDATDFREYKIYQHYSSGLDESTGILIHVATTIDDTVFQVIDLNPREKYFFRVYVMNEYGRLGGSNIVSGTTTNFQIIRNGSFEIINPATGYPINWSSDRLTEYYELDSLFAQDGRYSIKVKNSPGVFIYYQLINPSDIVANSRYQLTYWIKHDALSYPSEFQVYLNTIEFNWHISINRISGPKNASEWELYEYEFTAPDVQTSNYQLGFYFFLGDTAKGWVDNVSLLQLE